MFFYILIIFLNFKSAQAQQVTQPATEPVAHQPTEPEKPHNKLMLAVVGSKTLAESVQGDSWSFERPSVGVEIHANEFVAAQTSLTLLDQQYVLDKGGSSVLFERRRLILPVMISYRAFPWFYVSAGPYIGVALNEIQTYRRGLNPALRPPKSSMDDFLEFGFVTALQFFIPVTKKIEGMASIYYYAPYDETQLKKSNSLFFLFGVKFGLGK